MFAYRHLVLTGIVLLGHCLPTDAYAQSMADSERQKAKIISRLYQATYGAQQRCGAATGAQSHRETLARFRASYPELVSLMDSSPHLAAARDRFQVMLDTGALPQASEDGLRKECQALESILRSLVDAPAGAEAVAGYIEVLKK